MNRRLARNEDGAAIILVLALVFMLSLVALSTANFADTSILSTQTARTVRGQNYALDGAVDGAIQQIRYDLTQGRAPGYTNGVNVCSNYNAPATNSQTVTVLCQGEQGVQGQYDSGATTATNNPYNKPPTALTALAGASETGITLNANGVFRVHGNVLSRSGITTTSNSTLHVDGNVIANGPCTGNIATYDPPYTAANNYGTLNAANLQCNSSATVTAPDFSPSLSAVPAVQTVPTCPAGYLVTLQPGTYTDAQSLSNLASGTCTGKILWFKPGVYFFNFNNNGDEWDVGDATSNIVGGTPFGWSPTAATRPTIPQASSTNPAVHSCVTSEDAVPAGADPANLGVQFVFTGDSHMNIRTAGGNVELCAQPSATNQQIAVYGMPQVSGNQQTGVLQASGVSVNSGFDSTAGTNGLVIDGAVSTASIPATSTGASAALTYTGFNQLDATTLPATASITNATLKVAHLESSNAAISTVTADITAADGTVVPTQTVTPCFTSVSTCTQSIDVTRWLGNVAKLRSGTGQGPTIKYTVTNQKNKSSTATMDGLELDLTWVPKSLTAASATATTFANPTQGELIDGVYSSASLGKSGTGSVTLGGYNQLTTDDLPPGSVISKVIARVVHRESQPGSTISLSGTAADGSTFSNATVPACQSTTVPCRDNVDLTTYLGTEAKLRNYATPGATPTGPTIKYNITGPSSTTSTADLDGIRLDVTFVPSPLGSSSGCVTKTPYSQSDSTTCALLRAQGNKAFVSIHGTIYAPSAALDLKVMNGGTTVFGRGAIMRTLLLFFNPSVTYSDDNITIMIPDDSTFVRQDRVVDFWACFGRVATCDDTSASLHAVADFVDSTSAGATVNIRSWARRR